MERINFVHHFDGSRVPFNPKKPRHAHRQTLSSSKPAVTPEKEFTCAYLANIARREILCAISLCNPVDNYSRPRGRQISTARLKNYLENPGAETKHPNLFFRVPFTQLGLDESQSLEVIHPKDVHDAVKRAAVVAANINIHYHHTIRGALAAAGHPAAESTETA